MTTEASTITAAHANGKPSAADVLKKMKLNVNGHVNGAAHIDDQIAFAKPDTTEFDAGVKPTLVTGEWLDIIHKGGAFAHFWTQTGRYGESAWYTIGDTDGRRKAFNSLRRGDMYVSINPSSQIPPCNKSGNTNRRYIAKQTDYIGAINVLFAEYDGKDYVTPDEYAPYLPPDFAQLTGHLRRTAIKTSKEIAFYFDIDTYKARALAAVRACHYTPTIIVDSGGGYHCYWVLAATIDIDDSNRAAVVDTQHGWVKMNGGDIGACDISRVLRVIGTKNCKDGFGANKPIVTVIEYNPGLVYDYGDLESAVMDWQVEQRKVGQDVHDALDSADPLAPMLGTVRATFNARFKCVDLLKKRGYKAVHENKDKAGNVVLTRMSRPDKDGVPSVTIFPATDTLPEVAIMWSGNDELHSELTTDGNGKSKREGRDAFKIFATLYCDGNNQAAWTAAKKALGLWR